MAGACSKRNTFLPISANRSADCIPAIPAPTTNTDPLSPLILLYSMPILFTPHPSRSAELTTKPSPLRGEGGGEGEIQISNQCQMTKCQNFFCHLDFGFHLNFGI